MVSVAVQQAACGGGDAADNASSNAYMLAIVHASVRGYSVPANAHRWLNACEHCGACAATLSVSTSVIQEILHTLVHIEGIVHGWSTEGWPAH